MRDVFALYISSMSEMIGDLPERLVLLAVLRVIAFCLWPLLLLLAGGQG